MTESCSVSVVNSRPASTQSISVSRRSGAFIVARPPSSRSMAKSTSGISADRTNGVPPGSPWRIAQIELPGRSPWALAHVTWAMLMTSRSTGARSSVPSRTAAVWQKVSCRRLTRRVRTVDWRRPTKFNAEHERRVKRLHDTFCQTAAVRLGTELRAPVGRVHGGAAASSPR